MRRSTNGQRSTNEAVLRHPVEKDDVADQVVTLARRTARPARTSSSTLAASSISQELVQVPRAEGAAFCFDLVDHLDRSREEWGLRGRCGVLPGRSGRNAHQLRCGACGLPGQMPLCLFWSPRRMAINWSSDACTTGKSLEQMASGSKPSKPSARTPSASATRRTFRARSTTRRGAGQWRRPSCHWSVQSRATWRRTLASPQEAPDVVSCLDRSQWPRTRPSCWSRGVMEPSFSPR
jgi:hypothetical protein